VTKAFCCCVAQERIAAYEHDRLHWPIMLDVLFALLLALALWLFVDLPLFLPDEG